MRLAAALLIGLVARGSAAERIEVLSVQGGMPSLVSVEAAGGPLARDPRFASASSATTPKGVVLVARVHGASVKLRSDGVLYALGPEGKDLGGAALSRGGAYVRVPENAAAITVAVAKDERNIEGAVRARGEPGAEFLVLAGDRGPLVCARRGTVVVLRRDADGIPVEPGGCLREREKMFASDAMPAFANWNLELSAGRLDDDIDAQGTVASTAPYRAAPRRPEIDPATLPYFIPFKIALGVSLGVFELLSLWAVYLPLAAALWFAVFVALRGRTRSRKILAAAAASVVVTAALLVAAYAAGIRAIENFRG